jgi:hypothetical protein
VADDLDRPGVADVVCQLDAARGRPARILGVNLSHAAGLEPAWRPGRRGPATAEADTTAARGRGPARDRRTSSRRRRSREAPAPTARCAGHERAAHAARGRGWCARSCCFAEGDPLDPDRWPSRSATCAPLGILNRIEIVPADTTADGRVDLVVRAQETWTLSLGLNFALVSSGDLRWNLAMTEKNFLGYGTVLQAVVGDDLDARTAGSTCARTASCAPATLELNYDERSDGHTRWLGPLPAVPLATTRPGRPGPRPRAPLHHALVPEQRRTRRRRSGARLASPLHLAAARVLALHARGPCGSSARGRGRDLAPGPRACRSTISTTTCATASSCSERRPPADLTFLGRR